MTTISTADILAAIEKRHSVRQYSDKPVEEEKLSLIRNFIKDVNVESGLNIQLVENEPKAFDGGMASYGNFRGVKNYVALIGKPSGDFQEKCGYFGEKIVLFCQAIGLNTCWVALTYKKIPEAYRIEKGEKLLMVISLGYGETQGKERKSKTFAQVCKNVSSPPEWFVNGVNAALKAPTAINQQKFSFSLKGDTVSVKTGIGFYVKTDLGIVKYHFEVGSGKGKEVWAK